MICSPVYRRAFNPEKARMVIGLPEISRTEKWATPFVFNVALMMR